MRVTIEPATPRNLEELLAIERECFTAEAYSREQILGLLKNIDATALLARVNGEAAGFAIGIVEGVKKAKLGHIITIDVAVPCRRKGIGAALLNDIESILSRKGVEAIYLEVRSDNQPARKLYQKQGYVEAESLKHYYSFGVHGLRLIKRLQPKQDASL